MLAGVVVFWDVSCCVCCWGCGGLRLHKTLMRDLESVAELSQMILVQSSTCAGVWRVVDVKGEIDERNVLGTTCMPRLQLGVKTSSSATWSGIHLTCTAISVTIVHRFI